LKFNGKKVCQAKCVIYTRGIFDNIFRWQFFLERDISLIFCGHKHIIITHCLLAAIIYIKKNNNKKQGAQLWKGKRKRSHCFLNCPYPMETICVAKKLGIEGEFSNAQMTIYWRRQ
jgi:hypothetical protein